MYDIDMVFSEYGNGRDIYMQQLEIETSRDKVLEHCINCAMENIKYHGIPTSEEEFKIFLDLIKLETYNRWCDTSVFTDKEWEAIAKDIIAKAS